MFDSSLLDNSSSVVSLDRISQNTLDQANSNLILQNEPSFEKSVLNWVPKKRGDLLHERMEKAAKSREQYLEKEKLEALFAHKRKYQALPISELKRH